MTGLGVINKNNPSLTILEPITTSGGIIYCGLMIELKNDPSELYARDQVSFLHNERLTGQVHLLRRLADKRYHAVIACGIEEAKEVIVEYLDNRNPYDPNPLRKYPETKKQAT